MNIKCKFSHPLYKTFYEAELPSEMTFKEVSAYLIKEGFLKEKKGGYQYLIDDKLCKMGATLGTYLPEGVDCMEIRIHGLLVVLT